MFEREPDSRMSIPPVSGRTPLPEEPLGLRGIAAAAALCFAVAVPFIAHRVRGVEPSSASAMTAGWDAPSSEVQDTVSVAIVRAPAGAAAGAVVPSSAVGLADGRPVVFVVDDTLKILVETPVELGARCGSDQRVLSGVMAGQKVVAAAERPLHGALAQR